MPVKITYRSLIYSFFTAISLFGFSLYPMVSSAYPSLGSQCSTCHANSKGEQIETTTESTTTTDTSEISNSTTEQLVEEDVTENSTTEPMTEGTSSESTGKNTTESMTEGTTSESTTGKSTTEQTTTGTYNNKVTDFMTEFDINKDGQITQDEVQAIQKESFKVADTDTNGYLTKDEFKKGILSEKLYNSCRLNFTRLDNNLDTLISQDEFVNNVPLFDKFDLDDNGIVTAEELTLRNLYDDGMSHGKLHWMGSEKVHRGSMSPKGNQGTKHHSH